MSGPSRTSPIGVATAAAPRLVGSAGANLGAALTVTFTGAEEVWVLGVLNTTLTITLAGRSAGAKCVVLATQSVGGGNGLNIFDGTGSQSIPVPTDGSALVVVRAFCPNTTDI